MDEHTSDHEPLTKFLEDTKDYHLPSGPIKVKAFHPSNKYGTISVFRIQDASVEDIWLIANEFVAPQRKDFTGIYCARADLVASEVRSTGLDVKCEPSKHPRHADIIGWVTSSKEVSSEEAQNELREKRNEYAAKLFQIATLVLREFP